MASSLQDRGLELMAARKNRVRGKDKTRQDKTFLMLILLTISWHTVCLNISRGVPNQLYYNRYHLIYIK